MGISFPLLSFIDCDFVIDCGFVAETSAQASQHRTRAVNQGGLFYLVEHSLPIIGQRLVDESLTDLHAKLPFAQESIE